MIKKIEKIGTKREWICCPYCGAKYTLYDNTAECHGVFPVCTRGCHKEFELIIRDGKQVMKT